MIIIDIILDLLFIGLSVHIARLWYIDNKIKEEQTKLLQESFRQLEEMEKDKAGGIDE